MVPSRREACYQTTPLAETIKIKKETTIIKINEKKEQVQKKSEIGRGAAFIALDIWTRIYIEIYVYVKIQ